jgi:hypothetical protein
MMQGISGHGVHKEVDLERRRARKAKRDYDHDQDIVQLLKIQ